MDKKKKIIIISIIAVVLLVLGIVLGIVLGNQKSKGITYVNEYSNGELVIDGSNVTLTETYDTGVAIFKGTYSEQAYTSESGEVFTHAIHWTEYTFGGITESTDEIVPIRFVGDDIEYLSKEQAPKDDITTYTKK